MNTSRKFTLALAALAVLGASTLSLASLTSAQVPPPFPPASRTFRPHQERHPEIARALGNLARTEADLRRAGNDFGGHKLRAAELCRQAQIQLRLALQYDRN